MRAAKTHQERARNDRMYLRATAQQKKLICEAASRKGKTISDFVLESACAEAEQALADQRAFYISPAKWAAFTQALNAPYVPKPRLERLLSEPSILEGR